MEDFLYNFPCMMLNLYFSVCSNHPEAWFSCQVQGTLSPSNEMHEGRACHSCRLLFNLFFIWFPHIGIVMQDFKIQNIVGSCDVKFPIRLEGLAYSHGAFSSVSGTFHYFTAMILLFKYGLC